jgi:hypothetical protein
VTVRTIATVVLAAAMTIFALRESAPLVTPILVSVLLAYALEPAVELFMRAGLPVFVSVLFCGWLWGSEDCCVPCRSWSRSRLEPIASKPCSHSENCSAARRRPSQRRRTAARKWQHGCTDVAGPSG